jgi:hypothetical protein
MLPFDKFLPKKKKRKGKEWLFGEGAFLILRIASTLVGSLLSLHIITIYILAGNSEEYGHII